MMRVMFFIMGLPMMILSFFEAIDVMPFVQSVALISEGKEVVLTQEEQNDVCTQVARMLEKAHTLPAFGVITEEMFEEYSSQGVMVSLKFDKPCELMGLPFDELVFKIDEEAQGFDLIRGMNGVHQGRCIHIDLIENNMSELALTVDNILEAYQSEEKDLASEPAQEKYVSDEDISKDQENENSLENQSLNNVAEDEINII